MLTSIDALTDDNLTGFAIRLALAGHRGIPREGEFNFLTEAENVFISKAATKPKPSKAKKSAPLKTGAKPVKKSVIRKPKEPKRVICSLNREREPKNGSRFAIRQIAAAGPFRGCYETPKL